MPNITENDIKKVAKLARLEVAPESLLQLSTEVGKIIGWVDVLNDVDTNNIEPLTNVHEMSLQGVEDKISDGNKVVEVLKNSPNAKYDYFTVPKVIE